VHFLLLLIVRVKAELAAKLAEVPMYIQAVFPVGTDESVLVDHTKGCCAWRLGLVDI